MALFMALCSFQSMAQSLLTPPFIDSMPVKVDSFVRVRDELFYSPLLHPKLIKPYYESNKITLKINEAAGYMLPPQFTVTAIVKVDFVKYRTVNDSVVGTRDDTLTINYKSVDTDSIYTLLNSSVFDSVQNLKVTVKSVTITGAANTNFIVKSILIENQITPSPNFIFSCSNNAITNLSVEEVDRELSTPGELTLQWGLSIGADEYDVEWAFIDKEALASGIYGNASSPDAAFVRNIFNNNATRITTSDLIYRIPLIFPDTGTVYIRVRAVQRKPGGARLTSDWSSSYLPAGLGSYAFNGHQNNINWQSSITFAEEGKRKVVVQYYDGSLRSRQTVTKDNTTQKTVVAETLYDYQGRPTIQVLPSPTLDKLIQYTPNFNHTVDNTEYTKSEYDLMLNPAAYCSMHASRMGELNSGAASYYSSQAIRGKTPERFLPDANGYVFTETQYTQDNTGRISSQSGVGPTFLLGTGKETKYFYATAGQDELDALFGTEVGDHSHYFKNAVRDANGQFSISYVDMHGRTIATALAGDTIAGMKKLSTYYTPAQITERVNEPSDNVIKDLVMETHRSLLVTNEGLYSFNYDLDSTSLKKDNCNNVEICYNCLYDLEITITDDCNNQKLPGQMPYKQVIRQGSLAAINDTCLKSSAAMHLAFSLTLVPGNYEITKKLSVSQTAEDFYKENVFLPNNTCKTLEDFIEESRQLILQTECEPNCASCTEALGTFSAFYDNYVHVSGINSSTPDTTGLWKEVLVMYQEATQTCNALCGVVPGEYDEIRNEMLYDVSSYSGQYANPDGQSSLYSIFYGSSPSYKKPVYVDELGNPDKVFDDILGTFVTPDKLNSAQFAKNFKTSWAESLLPYHPEYCRLTFLSAYKNTLSWNADFENTATYQSAFAKGYMDPFTAESADPLTGNVKTSLQNKMNVFVTDGTHSLTMQQLAVQAVSCSPTDNACMIAFDNNPKNIVDLSCDADKDMAWRNFRSLYLLTKRDLIFTDVIDPAKCTGSPSFATLTAAGKIARFINAQSGLENAGLEYWTGLNENSDPQVMQDSINRRLDSAYTQNCRAYAAFWLSQLKTCANYSEQDINNDIIPKLVQVCKDGSDENHPLGSREVKPGTTGVPYKSFDEVIDDFNATHNVTNTYCTADIITSPPGYNTYPPLVNQPVYTKPDDCTCNTINERYTEYIQYAPGQYSSFSNYMQERYNTTISEADLTTLRNMCNNTSNCRFLPEPINIPPALQCGSTMNPAAGCVNCVEVQKWNDSFAIKYPGIVPTKLDSLPEQQTNNSLYRNFMNLRLGFNKQTWEYLDFLDSCNAASNATIPDDHCVTCDSLQKLVYAYFDTLTVSGGNEAEMLHFIYNKLNAVQDGTYTSIENIQTSLNSCNTGYYQNLSYQNWIALRFTGSHLDLGRNGNDFTAECWTNFNNDPLHVKPLFYNMSLDASVYLDTSNYYKGFYIYSDVVNSNRYIFCRLGDGVDRFKYIFIRTTTPLSGNIWYHVVVTKHGNLDTDIDIYVNGVKQSTVTVDGPGELTTGNLGPVGRDLLIGNTSFNGFYGFQAFCIKNARLYSRKLSSDEILSNYNDCTGNPNNMDSLRFWAKLNEGTLTPLDYSIYHSIQSWLTIGIAHEVDEIKSWTGKNRSNLLPTCLGTNITALCDLKTKDSLLLCGDMVFPEVVFTQVNNCSDSAFFAVSNGTERYSDYVDSLNNVFDSLYRSKCLQAYNYEVFTVTHTVSEYHYTLYFYDQAGNLVKTVPPQDVVPKRTANWFSSVRNARANHQIKTPSHLMETDYRYNTLNQVVQQSTPDAGISNYFYDRLGRLVLSKNAKQNASNKYSYTKYDYLGRIAEVGELQSVATMDASVSNSPALLASWMNNAAASRTDITFTAYDAAYPVALTGYLVPRNLRNRVAWMALYATAQQADNVVEQTTASFFSYDIHGNVDTLLQDFRVGAMADAQNRFKKIVYDYDLISGKVNMVSYQPGRSDAFYHKYQYDAENRLTDVFTSSDRIYWEHDAFYQYYRHGPLSRVVIGQQQVQGIDYAYTLQGWLKGVNSTALTPDLDMGSDGKSNGIVARDAFGFALHYFGSDTDQSIPANDYKPVSNTVNPFAKGYATVDFKPLFNGNIAAVSMNLKMGTNAITGSPLLYDYTYDQLNRLAAMRAFSGLDTLNNLWAPIATQDYAEDVSYDANGNILTYNRNGAAAVSGTAMDALKYKYYYINTSGAKIAYDPLAALPGDVKTLTNQLAYVTDDINSNYTEDIDYQLAGNYDYDGIGNLVKDVKEGITSITWTVYGKIKTINKNGGVVISYTYDASGNRISKNVNGKETWYVRDASGNVLSIYTKDAAVNGGNLTQNEVDIYGSSRLGILNRNNYVGLGSVVPGVGSHYYLSFTRGKKYYELTNHLGNVLTVVSDRKKPFAKATNQNVIDFYVADIKSVSDYYPFGMVMPGRKFTSTSYKYGFNGKEKDANITNEDYDYGMRIYDARLGRFLSVDPITKKYPELTPYQFASNSPSANVDLDGNESKYFNIVINEVYDGKGKLKQSTQTTTYDKAREAGFHLHKILITYTPSGRLGEGTLYRVSKVKNYAPDKNGVEKSDNSYLGSVYVPPPPKTTTEHPASSFSFGLQIFGSGYDPTEAPTNKATPNMKIISINFKEYQEIIAPILISMNVKSPTDLGTPRLDELLDHAGSEKIDQIVDNMNKRWEAKEKKQLVQCKDCHFFKDNGGKLIDTSNKGYKSDDIKQTDFEIFHYNDK